MVFVCRFFVVLFHKPYGDTKMSYLVPKMLLRGSRVRSQAVDWAWEGLVPLGKLTLVTGEPGIGKSLVATHVAARVTRGVTLSEGSDHLQLGEKPRQKAMGVIVLSSKDRPEDTVLPRLIADGADPSLVFFMQRKYWRDPEVFAAASDEDEGHKERPFRLSQDLDDLQGCLEELSADGISVGLIVIDSIDHYIGTDEKKSARIQAVSELEEFAELAGAAVLVTANLSMKAGSRGGAVVYQELMNTACSVLMVTRDLDDEDRRLVLPVKHNLIARPNGAAFFLGEPEVRWETERISISYQSYLHQARMLEKNPLIHQEIDELGRATRWLKGELESGYAPAFEVQQRAMDVHISKGTLRRAVGVVEVRTTKVGDRWFWSLEKLAESVVEEIRREFFGVEVGGVCGEDAKRGDAKRGTGTEDGASPCFREVRCANVVEHKFGLAAS